jgi:uncharacterized protein YceK
MKRLFPLLVGLMAMLSMSGCGTSLNVIAGKEAYGGVMAEARVIGEAKEEPVLAAIALCDLPLTIVGDTVTAPLMASGFRIGAFDHYAGIGH